MDRHFYKPILTIILYC